MTEKPNDPTPTEPDAPEEAPDVVPSLDPDQPSGDPQTQLAPPPE